MYERTVEVPRQYAVLDDDGAALHPIFRAMRRALDARYTTRFERLSLALYRSGSDSVAWHGDYVARRMPQALVATISVGAPPALSTEPWGLVGRVAVLGGGPSFMGATGAAGAAGATCRASATGAPTANKPKITPHTTGRRI
jgi:hypothetical protein